jgi:hypothetical protein
MALRATLDTDLPRQDLGTYQEDGDECSDEIGSLPSSRVNHKVVPAGHEAVLRAGVQADDGHEQIRVILHLPNGGGDLGVIGLAYQPDRTLWEKSPPLQQCSR